MPAAENRDSVFEQLVIHFFGLGVMTVIAATFLHSLEFDNEVAALQHKVARAATVERWMDVSIEAGNQLRWGAFNNTGGGPDSTGTRTGARYPSITAAENFYTVMMEWGGGGDSDDELTDDELLLKLSQMDPTESSIQLNILDPDMRELILRFASGEIDYSGSARRVVTNAETGAYTLQGFDWDYPSAVYFMCTIVSTIGPGTFVPKTTEGKVLTMINAVFGVGYFGFFLYVITDIITGTIRDHVRRGIKKKRLAYGIVPQAAGEQMTVPVPAPKVLKIVGICTVGYMAALVLTGANLSGWRYADSIYFAIITFTTIGLGDIEPRFDLERSMLYRSAGYFMWAMCTLVGIALLSALLSAVSAVLKSTRVSHAVVAAQRHRMKKQSGT